MSIRFCKKSVEITWSVFLTVAIFTVGLLIWLLYPFRFQGDYTGGIHLKHWILGLWSIAVGVVDLLITGVRVNLRTNLGRLKSSYGIGFRYVVIPYISSLIYFFASAVIILTELHDFQVFVSCPTNYDWTSPGASCLP